jgi:hypothetical protein
MYEYGFKCRFIDLMESREDISWEYRPYEHAERFLDEAV